MVIGINQLIKKSETNSQALKLAISELTKIDSDAHFKLVQDYYEKNIGNCREVLSFRFYSIVSDTNSELWKDHPKQLNQINNLQDDDSFKHVIGNKISALKLRTQNLIKAGAVIDEDFVFLKKYFKNFDPELIKKFKPAFNKLIKDSEFKGLPPELQNSILELKKIPDLILKIGTLVNNQQKVDEPLYVMVQEYPSLHINHIGMEYFYKLKRTINDLSEKLKPVAGHLMDNNIPEQIRVNQVDFPGSFKDQFFNNFVPLKSIVNQVIKEFESTKKFPIDMANEALNIIKNIFDSTSDKSTAKNSKDRPDLAANLAAKGLEPDNLHDTLEKTFDLYVEGLMAYPKKNFLIAQNIKGILKIIPDDIETATKKIKEAITNHLGNAEGLEEKMGGITGKEGLLKAADEYEKIGNKIAIPIETIIKNITTSWENLKECIEHSHKIENFEPIISKGRN